MGKKWSWQLRFAISLFFSSAFTTTDRAAKAQLIPDTTLGQESSRVTSSGVRNQIEGGAIRDNTLFHSFQEFNVNNGQQVYFAPPSGIANIFTRVTGSTTSQIFGTLGVVGSANLFLMNPNGIIFGSNAQLDVAGSFAATTAQSIIFDSYQFSATNPTAPPVLRINLTPGLQYGPVAPTSQIRSEGILSVGQDFSLTGGSLNLQGQLLAGNNLTLVGNSTSSSNSLHILAGGAVNINQIAITDADTTGNTINPTATPTLANVTLSDGSPLVINSTARPTLDIRAGTTAVLNSGTGSNSDTALTPVENNTTARSANITIGTIRVNTSNGLVFLTNQYQPNSSSTGNIQVNLIDTSSTVGRGGDILLDSRSNIIVPPFGLVTSSSGAGNSGNITLIANNAISVANNAVITTGTFPNGLANAGNINVTTRLLSMDNGAVLNAGISARGNGGNININARDSISLAGARTGIFTAVNPEAVGSGGNININTRSLTLSNGAQLSASVVGNGNGGELRVKAQQVELVGISPDGQFGSGLYSTLNPGATGKAGNLTVETDRLVVRDGAGVSTATGGNGDGGELRVKAQHLELIGTTADGRISSGLYSNLDLGATGKAGNLTVETDRLVVRDGAGVSTSTLGNGDGGELRVKAQQIELIGGSISGQFGSSLLSILGPDATGQAGNLTIETDRLVVRDGAQISTSSVGNGNGGELQVKAQHLELVGTSPDGLFGSGLYSTLNPGATGQAGNLTVEVDRLVVRNGAQISAGTLGNGNGGELRVKAQHLELVGTSPDGLFGSGLYSTLNPGATGKAGNLFVETDRLVIRDGAAISTATGSNEDGGELRVKAQQIELIGSLPNPNIPFFGGLTTFAGIEASGNGGNLVVDTERLTLADGAQVSTSSFGSGRAGDLRINTPQLLIRDRSQILATSQSGNGGNITLEGLKLLLLRNNSSISTTAGQALAGGDGGNITINAGFVVGVLNEGSDITANAFFGRGGNINITTNALFGLRERKQLTQFSDITAFSQQNPVLNGTIVIDTLRIDPNRGLTELPSAAVDPSDRIVAACPATPDARFVVTGRGGLPEDPRTTLTGIVVLNDFRTSLDTNVEGELHSRDAKDFPLPPTPTSNSPLVEAQSWVIDAAGNVELVVNNTNISSSSGSGGRGLCF
ncbi:GLUG motif-containing protein [Scytonema sp. NUACC21]